MDQITLTVQTRPEHSPGVRGMRNRIEPRVPPSRARWRTGEGGSLRLCTALALLVVSTAAAGEIDETRENDDESRLQDPVEVLTETQRERIAAGEVIVVPPREGEKAVGAAVWIHEARETVWRVMVDCQQAPEFVPGMRSCRVLEEDGHVARIEHRVKPMLLLPELTYVFRVEHHPHEWIRFRRVSGALREMIGEWRLRSDRGGTVVSYTVVLDPGFALPQWVVRRALKRSLPELLQALKERVEEPAPDDAAQPGPTR